MELKVNVTLNPEQKARIREQIVEKANVMKAIDYADISYETFNNSLKGGRMKSDQRDKLIQFCDLVEGKTAA